MQRCPLLSPKTNTPPLSKNFMLTCTILRTTKLLPEIMSQLHVYKNTGSTNFVYTLSIKENRNTATTAPTKKSAKAKHNKCIFNAPCMHLLVYKEQKWNPVQNILAHSHADEVTCCYLEAKHARKTSAKQNLNMTINQRTSVTSREHS